ncbi:hypothetical protein BaRGS_00032777 [Batillaria attramentaria]|uniref:PH domain-containing protein n=1 Tax=Batillaria attramentaria TaxID=370345 RepID=A0ABD0JLQ1_9CAEN
MAADLLRERLPPDWSYGVTSDGRVFFISERQRTTSWLHPVTGRPVQTGHQAAPGLPNGWEQDYTPEGATYFIDHNNQQTTFGHPITGRPISEEDPPPPPRSLKAPSAKRNPDAQVVRRGFLYRLESGGLVKAWKRRWCVLADFALFVYKSDDEKSALGSILLPGYRILPCSSEDSVQRDFAFKVEHENTKTVYFHTDSLSDFNDWLPHLQQAATMKGNPGFLREANNNNVKQVGQRSPPYSDPRRDHPDNWGGSHPNLDSRLESQWRNPGQPLYPGKGPSLTNNNQLPGQPMWKSVPDLGRENVDPRNGHREMAYDPQGSLRSLQQEGYRPRQDFGPNVPRNSRIPQDQQRYPPNDNSHVSDRDPRGSQRSLPHDDYRRSREFPSASAIVPAGSSLDIARDRESYPRSGFQPYQRPGDPQQRSSLVSDPGRHVDHGSYNVQHPQRNTPSGLYNPNYSNHDRNKADPRGHRPHDTSSDSMGSYRPADHSRQRSDGSREGSVRDRDPAAWRGSRSGPHGFDPHGRTEPNVGQYPSNGTRHPDNRRSGEYSPNAAHPESNSRPYGAQDPRASYASSGRHSIASHNRSLERDPRGFQQPQPHQQSHHGSRTSLSRVPPAPSSHPLSSSHPHLDVHGHTYVNVPEMRSAAMEHLESPPPERPPYPAAVREQIVKELADTRSPATAEMLLTSHEMNKERMERSTFFQYPTPPRDQPVSRLDDVRDGRAPDPAKRLSQYSDRNSLASGEFRPPANSQGAPGDRGSRSQRGSSNDYSDSGRRQDSGSGRFSDSFERRSADERKGHEGGRGVPGVGGVPNDKDGGGFGGDPEARSLRQAYERVQSFRQSSAAGM